MRYLSLFLIVFMVGCAKTVEIEPNYDSTGSHIIPPYIYDVPDYKGIK